MTKVWRRAAREEEFTEVSLKRHEVFESGFSAFHCEPVSGRYPRTTLKVIRKHPPADFFNAGSMFVVSDRLKSILEEFKVKAEFFLLEVIYRKKKYTERTFYHCNILDLVDCLDFRRGQFEFETKPGFTHLVDKIVKLAIDEKKAAGHDLFRIARGGESNVCVSDRVASRITEQKMTGVRFVNPEDWEFGVAVD